MVPTRIASLCLAGAAASLALASFAGAPAEDPPARDRVDPGRYFRTNCAACHAVPDPAIATDRAWLDQVRRTS